MIGPVTTAAEAAGVQAGMRMGEALATCPGLVLVEQDPAAVEQEWEGVLRRLEDSGFAVESAEPGVVTFETQGVERLYGGVEAALARALASVGPAWDPRAGAGARRFVALAAASVARPGQAVIVEGKEEQGFLEPLPLSLLPLPSDRYAELEGLGVRRLGELASLPGGAVEERLGPEGKRAWSLAGGERGTTRSRVRGRSPAAELAEALSFPEAVANELTLRRAFGALLDRLLARPERAGRPLRKVALSARLVGGGSWRRATTLREATAERGRLRSALGPEAARAPGAGDRAAARGGRARRPRRQPAHPRPSRGGADGRTAARGIAAGAGQHRDGLRLRGGGGGSVVADPGSTGARRTAGRLMDLGEASASPALLVSLRRQLVSAAGGSWASRPHALTRSAAGRLNAPTACAGRGGRRRLAPRRQPGAGRVRARGVAGRRPLVDGGATRPPLLRGRARVGAERVRLPRPRAWLLVHAAGHDEWLPASPVAGGERGSATSPAGPVRPSASGGTP